MSVQNWIDNRLTEPDRSLERIAHENSMSLRYPHLLFQQSGMSVSEWILNRRLQRCFGEISKSSDKSITVIAYENGFNSSALFDYFQKEMWAQPT